MSSLRASASLLALVAVSACATGLSVREPFPILAPAAALATPRLVLSPLIHSTLYADCPDGLFMNDEETGSVRLVQWRPTLVKGFDNGFPKAALDDPSALRFELLEAVPALKEASRDAYGRVSSVSGAVRYKAQLVDASGVILRRSEGVAVSTRDSSQLRDIPDLIANAVEVMYQAAARDFFVNPG